MNTIYESTLYMKVLFLFKNIYQKNLSYFARQGRLT